MEGAAGLSPLLLVAVALGSDRWVEHDTALRRAWIAGQDEVARAWPDQDGRVAAVTAWMAAWRGAQRPAPRLADHRDGVTLWVASRPAADQDDLRKAEWTQELLVQRGDEAPVAVPFGEPDHLICHNLLADGRAFVGRRRPLEPGEKLTRPSVCALWTVDLDTLAVAPFAEGPWAHVVDGPGGVSWTVSGRRRVRVETRDAEGTTLDVTRWWRRRAMNTRPDGELVAWRGRTVWRGDDLTSLRPMLRHRAGGPLLAVEDEAIWTLTTQRANGGEVVEIEVEHPAPARWRSRVAERPGSDLAGAWVHDGRLVTAWSRDGAVTLESQPLEGGPSVPVALEGGPWTWTTMFRTWDPDGAVLRARSPRGTRSWRVGDDGVLELLESDLRDELVLETLRFPTPDGDVPVSLLRRADATPDGEGALWAYVYGGFGHSQAATLDVGRELFLAAGGAVAVIHARGGRERGEDWHLDAREEHLDRTLVDVDAAVRGLVAAGWAREGRVALEGASNGGLTVAAALATSPRLYGAVVASAGVMDLVEGASWAGHWWPDEYGRPRGDQREVLEALSPRHHPPEWLPPTLVITGAHDPVVPPRHSYTLAAAWDAQPGGPLLLRVDGHGTHGGRRTERHDRLRSEFRGADAHTVAFLLRALEMEVPPPPGPRDTPEAR